MSLPGLLRHRGALADIYRPATADGAGGLATITWPAAAVVLGVRVLADVISDELAQKIFGRERVVDLRALVAFGTDVAQDDGLVFRTGPYAGQRFRVTGVVPSTVRSRSQHLEVALERTTEVFG